MFKRLENKPFKNEVGKVVQSIEPVVLNRIDMKQEYINQVKKDLKSISRRRWNRSKSVQKHIKPAGKTGTAQTVYGGENAIGRNAKGDGRECYNLTLAGYAPYDDRSSIFCCSTVG